MAMNNSTSKLSSSTNTDGQSTRKNNNIYIFFIDLTQMQWFKYFVYIYEIFRFKTLQTVTNCACDNRIQSIKSLWNKNDINEFMRISRYNNNNAYKYHINYNNIL